MKLGRTHVLNALIAVVVGAAAVWIVRHTEWVDVEVPLRQHADVARDKHYALKQIVKRLGGTVVAPQNLDRLPPPGATLVLGTWQWNAFPEREQALRQWVEAGGHLVVEDWSRDRGLDWLPIERVSKFSATRPADAPPAPPVQPSSPRGSKKSDRVCWELIESETTPQPAYGTPRSYTMCSNSTSFYRTRVPIVWSLDGPRGPEVVRVAVGRGSVTALSQMLSDNRQIVNSDHALVFIAALRLASGGEVWLADSESRPPLLTAIWQAGAPAVLLGALLVALLLWRGAVRFGPPVASTPPARRSVAEQIRGTAGFIFQRDRAALHRAQLRALEATARGSIAHHDRLDRRSRAKAIAQATALDADALAQAMDPALKRPRRELLATLTLLETALRRLKLNR